MRQAQDRRRDVGLVEETYQDIVRRHREPVDTVDDDPIPAFDAISGLVEELDPLRRQSDARAMAYEDYLQTEHWKITRRAILNRSNRMCVRCGSATSLNVHHRTYERLGAEEYADLEVLCRDCHAKEHGIGGVS